MVATQSGLVPGLTVTSYTCVDLAGATVTGTCRPGDWVQVSVARPTSSPSFPSWPPSGPITLTSVSSAEIQ